MKAFSFLFLGVLAINFSLRSQADEIGFVEDFSLAIDREKPLSQLIPGTDDFYYYHCLHSQNNERYDQVDAFLKSWETTAGSRRFSQLATAREIRHRQALLTYARTPERSLEYLKRELGLRFNHQRERQKGDAKLSSTLDQAFISRESFRQDAFRRHNDLGGFSPLSYQWLARQQLTAEQRRDLLNRLATPDYENLVELVQQDLRSKGSAGFGSIGIHHQMTLQQLQQLNEQMPAVLNDGDFINTYLGRLLPNDDVDAISDSQVRRQHLDRMWDFVRTLSAANNSLKTHVLYQILKMDLKDGTYDKSRLLEYLKLPRSCGYIDPDYMRDGERRRYTADLNADFASQTQMPPIHDDERVVRAYLQHFFVEADSYSEFAPFLRDDYVKELFAETKLINGLGDAERWYAMLSPSKVQQLKDRVEIQFASTNRTKYDVGDEVTLLVHTKNVPTLLVKVYRINAANYYKQTQQEINTDISLDGLVAKDEQTYDYGDAPILRVGRQFRFPELDRAGTYVIDFIGNGISSRALIRKGNLRVISRTVDAGQLISVINDANEHVKDARVWMAGRDYEPDKNGRILLPFSHSPASESLVLTHGDIASRQTFAHQGERYSLETGIYVDRESLLAGNQAQIVVRPGLYLNGIPVTRKFLNDIRLTILSTDHDGISTSETVSVSELTDRDDLVHMIRVPERTSDLTVRFDAKVKLKTTGEDSALTASDSFAINSIDKTDSVATAQLVQSDAGYSVEVRGRNGEPLPDVPVQVSFNHREFTDQRSIALQAGDDGAIHLGTLADIERVQVTIAGSSFSWDLNFSNHSFPNSIHTAANAVLRIPLTQVDSVRRESHALFELRNGVPSIDRYSNMSLKDGAIRIEGLPPGDYRLHLKGLSKQIHIRVTDGASKEGCIVGESRSLEARGQLRLRIANANFENDHLAIKLADANNTARVHIFATRYVPAFDAFARLGRVRDAEPILYRSRRPQSLFVEGRRLGEEMQYVLDRRFQERFPGNLLDRPEVLLNPWAVRDTATTDEQPTEGEDFAARPDTAANAAEREAMAAATQQALDGSANLDFLANASVVAVNLKPDENGVVRISQEDLGDAQRVVILAADFATTSATFVTLPAKSLQTSDLRLASSLPNDTDFAQQRKIEFAKAGSSFKIASTSVPEINLFSSTADVFQIMQTLANDETLRTFRFILQWHELSDESKQEKYSEFACHELNFYLYKKDRPFFDRVVRPYLANKYHKTFLDNWLLNRDLTAYLHPWHFGQLNTFERILLSQRTDNKTRAGIVRSVFDQVERLPDDLGLQEMFGATVLKSRGLSRKSSALAEQADKFMFGVPRSPRLAAPKAAVSGPARGRRRGGQLQEDAKSVPENDFAFADDGLAAESLMLGDYDAALGVAGRQLYRPIDKTQEWAENNYYHKTIDQQNTDLIRPNEFWLDYAKHTGNEGFISDKFAHAANSFSEIMLALSVLDLPTQSVESDMEFAKNEVTVQAKSPLLIAYESIQPAESTDLEPAVLVSQNFFRVDDRFRMEGNRRVDKFVTEEFVRHVVYGCQLTITNSTSSPERLAVLTQIPQGAMPLAGSRYSRSQTIELPAYQTQSIEYHFYFPAAGQFEHYSARINKDNVSIAAATPFSFNVVDEPTVIDRKSWNYVSQQGSDDEVITFLQDENLEGVELSKIAFRMKEKAFFTRTVEVLAQRFSYDQTLWSYAVLHDVPVQIEQYLNHADQFVASCGASLHSELLQFDPVARKTYEHLEYRPLVNARAHRLGPTRKILNDRFHQQYHRWLKTISYRRQLTANECLAATYYLLLQDRIAEAWAWFERINPEELDSQVQYDYAAAYLDFFNEDQHRARSLANRYADYPVDRWRKLFGNVASQLNELDSGKTELVDATNRDQQNANLAQSDVAFDLTVDDDKVELSYRNVPSVKVNYYLMDIELLFSRSPFVTQHSNQFSFVEPNLSDVKALPASETQVAIDVPDSLNNKNVLVEISANGQTQAKPFFSNSMSVFLQQNYGQLQVVDKGNRPLPETYVKVYAEMQNGKVQFYKDGYTDLRGRFDYTSLSTNQLDSVNRFSILIMSDKNGAAIREATPPKH
ncbi:MAG: hypothetical protein KDB27_12385 [Planctomycetales bacterium]|nr:hypothetical protein [Planctomycetales bacterium]